MSFPRYPEYKDSGDPMIVQVPQHWTKTALKRLANYQNGYPFKPDDWGDSGRPIIRIAQLTGGAEPDRYDGIVDERVAVYQGDLLFSWSATLDSFFWQGEPAWLNQHIFKVTPSSESTNAFLYFLIKFWAPKLADVDAHGSTMRHIKKESLGQGLFIPPIDEQTAIATFLDRETAKIDALVAEQEKLIALLQEKRQAVISHAVTKGLDPNVPMKDSGVEWLGEVPAHWQSKRLKFLASNIKAGPFGSALTKDMYVNSGYRVYGQEQVIPGDFSIGDYYIDQTKFAELAQYEIRPDDLLISCVGTFGKIAVVPVDAEPGIINPRLIRLRTVEGVLPLFLAEVLRSAVTFEQFSVLSRGGTMDVINIGTLSDIWIALPPTAEQSAILSEITSQMARFDALMTQARTAITLLQERRTALISAAVTGQIDVRGLMGSANAPDSIAVRAYAVSA